jgi:hypothetical protein
MNSDLRKKDEGELEKECIKYGVQYGVPAIGEIFPEEIMPKSKRFRKKEEKQRDHDYRGVTTP